MIAPWMVMSPCAENTAGRDPMKDTLPVPVTVTLLARSTHNAVAPVCAITSSQPVSVLICTLEFTTRSPTITSSQNVAGRLDGTMFAAGAGAEHATSVMATNP